MIELLTHNSAGPLIAAGIAGVPGLTVTGNVVTALVPQSLEAVTVIFPFWPVAPVVTVIEVLPCPEVIAQPAGTVHV
jgi:hypothetical protein